jgi:transcriptional regulator with XRE-family HTH domain
LAKSTWSTQIAPEDCKVTDKSVLGAAVVMRRQSLGLSQSHLASLSGVSRGTIRNLEAGMFEPSPATWRAVQSVLGWASGSKELLEAGETPIELLPRDVLAMILNQLVELGSYGRQEEYEPIMAQFRNLMSRANRDGAFPRTTVNAIADFIYEFPWFEYTELFGNELISLDGSGAVEHASEEQIEAVQEQVIGRIQAALKIQERKKPPDRAEAAIGPGGSFRFATGIRPVEQASAEPTAWDQLSPGVKGVLSDGQVVDYGIYEPDGSETLLVVALLVKTGTGPLSQGDRQYLSASWNDFARTLRADPSDSQA